jgi:hypothetical protein
VAGSNTRKVRPLARSFLSPRFCIMQKNISAADHPVTVIEIFLLPGDARMMVDACTPRYAPTCRLQLLCIKFAMEWCVVPASCRICPRAHRDGREVFWDSTHFRVPVDTKARREQQLNKDVWGCKPDLFKFGSPFPIKFRIFLAFSFVRRLE